MKIYDKEVYNRQEEIRNIIIIIISFLVGFFVGYMANTITHTENNTVNNINDLSSDNRIEETGDNGINEAIVKYNLKDIIA